MAAARHGRLPCGRAATSNRPGPVPARWAVLRLLLVLALVRHPLDPLELSTTTGGGRRMVGPSPLRDGCSDLDDWPIEPIWTDGGAAGWAGAVRSIRRRQHPGA